MSKCKYHFGNLTVRNNPRKRPFLYSVLSKGMVFSLPLEESYLYIESYQVNDLCFAPLFICMNSEDK